MLITICWDIRESGIIRRRQFRKTFTVCFDIEYAHFVDFKFAIPTKKLNITI
jgi:hypothetical protein